MRRVMRLCLVLGLGLASASALADDARMARGEYLATVANCAGCHTAPGGPAYAGGLRLGSDYGTFITPNITPDRPTGIGDWTADDFYRAMHDGERPDGSSMYPACPYPNYTHATRDDIDAIHAYLQRVPAVEQSQPDHDLGFPYRYRSLLAVWKALYFEPGALADRTDRTPEWRRGRYLVESLGHCDACHRSRTALGAADDSIDAPGGIVHDWYAPSLADPAQAGLQDLSIADAAAFLTAGKHGDASMMGPMAGVVFESLQYLHVDDARAMAAYLTAMPRVEAESPQRLIGISAAGRDRIMARGGDIYAEHCASCHGDDGRGDDGAPALAGNRAVTMHSPINAANMIREGGFAPATDANPRPHGMPPFHQLSDRDLAAVLTYIRGSWGNDAPPVSTKNLRP